MEKQQLLETLNGLIGKYQQHRHYIDKAKTQLGKFSAAVIEKVVLDHEIKASDIADEVTPLLPQLREHLAKLEEERSSIQASKGTVDEELQELELRMLIGELEAEEFEQLSQSLRERQGNTAERISAIDGDYVILNSILEQWASMAGPAGHYQAPGAPAPAAPAPAAPAPVAAAPAPAPTPEPVAAEVGSHMSVSKFQEDVGSVFSEAPAQVRVGEDEVEIETREVDDDTGGEIKNLAMATESPDIDVRVDATDMDSGMEVEIPGLDSAPEARGSEGQRRALLLYQEGHPDEQIYPFTGDQLTVGRGRENDIQIKNDSKVSRYHCRIARRGNNFYIEDVKSSNGTLVNGELVTERRLFGGEEVIIGETFFRFRILD